MIHCYSPTLGHFVSRLEELIKDSLHHDFHIMVNRKRFLYKGYYYPINLTLFERTKEIAYFNPTYFQLGFHRRLQWSDVETLKKIIQHELLHYVTFLEFGSEIKPHGDEFKTMGKNFNLPDEIILGTMKWPEELFEKEEEHNKILEKIKKILNLAESSNWHEKEVATMKAHDLMLKHQLDHTSLENGDMYYSQKILIKKKKDSELLAIGEILRHFFVYPITNLGRGEASLEVFGKKEHLELAEYLSEYLQRILHHHWLETKKKNQLSGLRAKNSFYEGVAQGFTAKMNSTLKSYPDQEQRALIIQNQQLQQTVYHYWPSLRTSSSGRLVDLEAQQAGIKVGQHLNLHAGLKTSQSPLHFLK